MTFTGDILLALNDVGDIDISYQNGQPTMTDGFETCMILAIFGEPCVLNGAGGAESEKFISTFPTVIKRATVSDTTRQDGEKAIERALAFMVSDGMASAISVTGVILSARAIGWQIEIEAPTGVTKYAINWEKGSLTVGFSRVA